VLKHTFKVSLQQIIFVLVGSSAIQQPLQLLVLTSLQDALQEPTCQLLEQSLKLLALIALSVMFAISHSLLPPISLHKLAHLANTVSRKRVVQYWPLIVLQDSSAVRKLELRTNVHGEHIKI
jgi:hypothetical protein